MYQQRLIPALLMIGPVVMLPAISMDLYIPAIPRMMYLMETTAFKVQVTLSIFILGMSLFQLFAGPLVDCYGRKNVVTLSCVLYIIASILCGLARSIELLIAARLLQSIGACGCIVACQAWVRDSFDDKTAPTVFSFVSGTIGLAPILAPILGGYLLYFYDSWRSSFVFLTLWGIGCLALILSTWVEHLPIERRIPLNRSVFSRYLSIVRNKDFQVHAFSGSTGLSALFLFFSVSPLLLIDLLKVPEHHFGFYFGLTALVFFISSLTCPLIRGFVGHRKTLILAHILIILGALSIMAWHVLFGLTAMGVIMPSCLVYAGVGQIMGPSVAGALRPFREMAGTAAAVYGLFQFATPTLIGTIVMLLGVKSMLSFAWPMLFMSSIGLIWSLMHQDSI